MASKYFTHFVADSEIDCSFGEWSGVVELTRPLRQRREVRELALVLANNLDVEPENIRILEWSRLH